MVLFHTLRCVYFGVRGSRAYKHAINALKGQHPSKPNDALDAIHRRSQISAVGSTTVYCGLRLADMYGHVNNAKYLEIMEFARWHQIGLMGLGTYFRKYGVHFIVADLSIQYIREIKPFSRVRITTQLLPDSGSSDNKRVLACQNIWNLDGTKLHASTVMQVALIGSQKHAERLEALFPSTQSSGEGAASGGSTTNTNKGRRVTLDTHKVLADYSGLSLDELNAALQSVEARWVGDSTGGWLHDMNASHQQWRRALRNTKAPTSAAPAAAGSPHSTEGKE